MAPPATAGIAPLDVLSRFVADLRWADVPAAVRDSARNRTLDALACGVGALRAEAVQRVLATLLDSERSGPATLLATGGHATLDGALLANGVAVHALYFEDVKSGRFGPHFADIG